MLDENCPYCNAEIEINHDDGYGYEENKTHHQECGKCGKVFVYTTNISYSYYLKKADCLNGGEHKYEETHTFPKRFTKLHCKMCGDTKDISKERLEEIIKIYGDA